MNTIRNISTGARGAYLRGPKGEDGKDKVGDLVMVEPGHTAEGDFVDVNDEWFDDGEDSGLTGKTVAELRDLAEAENVNLGDASKKADIIAAIELAREA